MNKTNDVWEAVGAAKDTGEERQGMRFIIATKTNRGAMISRCRGRDVTCVQLAFGSQELMQNSQEIYCSPFGEIEGKEISLCSFKSDSKEKLGNYCFLSCFRKIQLGARATWR